MIGPVRIDRSETFYTQGRNAIEQNRYERAVDAFDRVIAARGTLTDAAMYWKAYSLSKMARVADALTTVRDLQTQFADSRWLRDARALELELRQATGQPVAADAQNDEELKLLALRGLMQTSPETAIPVIEKMLASNNTPRVKERALFLLSQSGSPRAQDLTLSIARGGPTVNPDLQLRAIRNLGMTGTAQGRQALEEIYRSSTDISVKRTIIRSYMTANAGDRLLAVAKSESVPELRGEAIQQLGAMGATSELEELYRTETSADLKRRILQSLAIGGRPDVLINLAKTEPDPELKRLAVRNLGMRRSTEVAEALTAIYASTGADQGVRRSVLEALFMQNNAKALVDLARTEKDPEMRKAIVQRLSMMREPEATAYLMELLK